MPKVRDERGSKMRSRRPTTGGSIAATPFGGEGGQAATTEAVAAGEMETVVDADEANELRRGVAWDEAVCHGLVDAR